MLLRRSARTAKPAIAGAPESLYNKATANGSSRKTARIPQGSIDPSAPSLEPQQEPDALTKATTTLESKVTKNNAISKKTTVTKKAAASRKRKVSEPKADLSVEPIMNNPDGSGSLTSNDVTPDTNGVDDPPATPLPKRRRRGDKADTASPTKPVPFTPTPLGVGLVAGSSNVLKANGKVKEDQMFDSLAALNRNRPAAPDVTNAPVLTPSGSQVVVNDSPSKKRKANDLPPDVGSPMKSTSTIDTLLKDAEAYLTKVDEEVSGKGRLERLIAKHHCKMFNPEGLREVVDPFTALASGIIGQQVRLDH